MEGRLRQFRALVVVRWRASWSLVLLAMIWFPSSDNCVEDCISVSSSEGGTTRVEAMLSLNLKFIRNVITHKFILFVRILTTKVLK